MDKELLLKMLARIDVPGLLMEDILEGFLYKKIDELVLSSENKLDDALAEILKPILKAELEKLLVAYLEGLKK